MLSGSSVKRALNVDIVLSSEMTSALDLWAQMYQGRAPWLVNGVKSLGLEAAIAGEIARAVTIEMDVRVEGDTGAGDSVTSRAAVLHGAIQGVTRQIREHVEKGVALGGMMFKPYVDDGALVVDFVPADQFYPVAFSSSGRITAAVFAEQKQRGESYYTRLEYHEVRDEGYVIRNRAFKSSTKDALGNAVPLTEVNEWSGLLPDVTVQGVDRPLFAYFRFPLANNIDPSSPLGISCFHRARHLIRQADEHWGRFIWEFESGERALYVDEQAFDTGPDGKPLLPERQRRLYRTLATAGQVGGEELFQDWSPTIREVNLLNGLNAILRRIEYVCGLAYGTLSEPQIEAKTATEIRTSMQRSYVTITDTQKALETALDGLLYAMDVWATLYNLAPRGVWKAEYTWGDSVVADKELQMAQDRQSVTMGVMPKTQFLMRHYRLTEQEAADWLKQAQDEQPQDPFGFEGAGA